MMIDFAGGHGVQQTQLCSYCTRQAELVVLSSVGERQAAPGRLHWTP